VMTLVADMRLISSGEIVANLIDPILFETPRIILGPPIEGAWQLQETVAHPEVI